MIMKKILFSVVCLMNVGMQSMMAQVAVAALHHEGNVTIYPAAKIQDAIDAAVKGDTLYLSEGVFGGFTIATPIAIIGAGQTTSISTDVTIGKSGTTIEGGLLLSGLNFVQNVKNKYSIDGLRIIQCTIGGDLGFTHDSMIYSNIEVFFSHVKGEVDLYTSVKSLTVVNSKVFQVGSDGATSGAVSFLNCNVKNSRSTYAGPDNVYSNCIVETVVSSTFLNCLYNTHSSGTLSNCYQTLFTLDEDLNSPLPDEELRANGFLGTDGTVVGITGGSTPYTLVTPTKQVIEHDIEVDNAARKMKVTLKLGNK